MNEEKKESLYGEEPPFEIKCSDGIVINLKQARHHFLKKISHLPKVEQKILDIKYSRYRSYLGKIGSRNRGVYGQQKQVLNKYKEEVLELFGRMFTAKEVQSAIFDLYGHNITERVLYNFRRDSIEIVAAKIEKHQKTHSELRLAHKKSRIEEYTELYAKLKEQYLKSPKAQTLNSLKSVLEAIRVEVDGDLVISGALEINLNQQINHHFQQEVYKTANVQDMIISRVAAKSRISPLLLMHSIQNSYYKNLNDKNVEDIDWEEHKYPSEQVYEYDKIEQQYEKRKEERSEFVEKEITKKTSKITDEIVDSFKEKMLSKLKDSKEVLRSKENILKAIEKVRLESNKEEKQKKKK